MARRPASRFALSILAAGLLALPAHPPASAADDWQGLEPGAFVVRRQPVPVRIVLVGFEPGTVDPAAILEQLPARTRPVVRAPRFYGLAGRDLALDFHIRARVVRKGRAFADQLFTHLSQIGRPAPLTDPQITYNDQASNLVDVTAPILEIDAVDVERWLLEHDPAPTRGYTVYFLNWWGRDDFRFHVYRKTDRTDVDTGANYGAGSLAGPLTSWGGSAGRSWFYDFSAGPDFHMDNALVDAHDLTGDGREEYRMPVAWEYDPAGYRDPSRIGFDIGLLTRWVAINGLFTPSPLFDPLVTAPGPDGAKALHVNLFEDDPEVDGLAALDARVLRSRLRGVQPYHRWKLKVAHRDPIDAQTRRSVDIWQFINPEPDCWTAFGSPRAQLLCDFRSRYADLVPDYRPDDYVAEVFAFNRVDGFDAIADDNWTDGTQEHIYAVSSGPARAAIGAGFTALLQHEVGHHLGLSHVTDGYDSQFGFEYHSFIPELWFVWIGNESNTVMGSFRSDEFGVFDGDNLHRWDAAGYLNLANALAGELLAAPDAGAYQEELEASDARAAAALDAFDEWRFLDAATEARRAYEILARAARSAGLGEASGLREASGAERAPATEPPCWWRAEDGASCPRRGASSGGR